jgi:hypothetical protein
VRGEKSKVKSVLNAGMFYLLTSYFSLLTKAK